MIIYKVTNTIIGKSYIGKTIRTLEDRKKEHKNLSKYKKLPFYKSIRKRGWDKFIWKVIEECNNEYDLNLAEQWYIRYFHSHITENGYNLTWGGEGVSGWKHTEETRKKLSRIHTGRKLTESHKNNISKGLFKNPPMFGKRGDKSPLYGRKHREESLKKMSKSQKGHKHSQYGKKGKESHNSKSYRITFPDGSIEIIKGLTQFCKEMKEKKGIILQQPNLTKVAKGYRKSHKGFKCEYF